MAGRSDILKRNLVLLHLKQDNGHGLKLEFEIRLGFDLPQRDGICGALRR